MWEANISSTDQYFMTSESFGDKQDMNLEREIDDPLIGVISLIIVILSPLFCLCLLESILYRILRKICKPSNIRSHVLEQDSDLDYSVSVHGEQSTHVQSVEGEQSPHDGVHRNIYDIIIELATEHMERERARAREREREREEGTQQ